MTSTPSGSVSCATLCEDSSMTSTPSGSVSCVTLCEDSSMTSTPSGSVSCVTLCEDSSMMAVGFSSSTVRVWSLIPQKLRAMKSADDLADIDKDAGKPFVD